MCDLFTTTTEEPTTTTPAPTTTTTPASHACTEHNEVPMLFQFSASLKPRLNDFNCLSRESIQKGRLGTVDLLAPTSLDQLKILFNVVTNKLP